METNNTTLSSTLAKRALPQSDTPIHTTEISVIRTTRGKHHNTDILLFDLTIKNKDYAVTLMTANQPYLLVFQLKRSRRLSLVFKVFFGFKVANYYEPNERKQIADFFGITLSRRGSFGSLFKEINDHLKYRSSSEIAERTLLLQQQDHPEDAEKIYFRGFYRNTGLRSDGTQKRRSKYNSWKTQLIFPEIWDEIANDPSVSVTYTDIPLEGENIGKSEAASITSQLRLLKH
ncbi:hypothetical protein LCAUW4_0378 [Lacticaseibacillus casei UW4]|jgi:hypothetical protein|uniref:DUF6037 family protein n=3 Tax=Lacticaseibacillus paracasei TaxID=1597 RepID=UPI000297D228|nr:DUF6037 family protein [Lacticaseibacillus paracasei]EKQ24227.1 hypothetical protein LCAUW4_0378 [Lacticaseibacillus casei UW4]OUC65578.1 hypothetical protein BLL69_2908c [Lacticaseibacillus paracasei]